MAFVDFFIASFPSISFPSIPSRAIHVVSGFSTINDQQ